MLCLKKLRFTLLHSKFISNRPTHQCITQLIKETSHHEQSETLNKLSITGEQQQSALKALCNQKTVTGKQVTSQCGTLECSYIMCVAFIYPPTPLMCTPSSYSRYMSPLMDIKCFFFVALSWTYIRDRKSIYQPINRAHTHTGSLARVHTYTRTL